MNELLKLAVANRIIRLPVWWDLKACNNSANNLKVVAYRHILSYFKTYSALEPNGFI